MTQLSLKLARRSLRKLSQEIQNKNRVVDEKMKIILAKTWGDIDVNE
jgi:hypothetical protein